jgi:hypothetical protein
MVQMVELAWQVWGPELNLQYHQTREIEGYGRIGLDWEKDSKQQFWVHKVYPR